MKIAHTFIVILISFFLMNCSGEDTEKFASEKTINDLYSTPGFEWFEYEYSQYTPDSFSVKQIDSLWKLRRYRFIVFVQPSCNCSETQKVFPSIIKSLQESNVPDSAIKIYLVLDFTYSHPFEKKFKVVSLPGCFTEIDSSRSKYYSCVDTFNLYKVLYPGQYKIEDIIAFSLK